MSVRTERERDMNELKRVSVFGTTVEVEVDWSVSSSSYTYSWFAISVAYMLQ